VEIYENECRTKRLFQKIGASYAKKGFWRLLKKLPVKKAWNSMLVVSAMLSYGNSDYVE